MSNRVKVLYTFDQDVADAIEQRATAARLSKSAWLNQFLAQLLLGGTTDEERTSGPDAGAPVEPKPKRLKK